LRFAGSLGITLDFQLLIYIYVFITYLSCILAKCGRERWLKYGVFISVFGATCSAIAGSRAKVSQVLHGVADCNISSVFSCNFSQGSGDAGLADPAECKLLLVESGIGVDGGDRSCAFDSGCVRIAFSNALDGDRNSGIINRLLIPFSRHA
jgi:hypothetical protein